MISIVRRVGAGPNATLFKVTASLPDRADQIAVWRGGTWNSRPIRAELATAENGSRGRQGVRVGERFFSLVEIMNSPETVSPIRP